MNCTMMLVGVSPLGRMMAMTRMDIRARIGPRMTLPTTLSATPGAALTNENDVAAAAVTAPL